MANRPSWKVLTVGAAIAGLGIAGTGIAIADNGPNSHDVQPIEVSSIAGPADADDNGDGDDRPAGGQAIPNNPDHDSPDNTPDDDHDSPDDTPDNDSPDDDRDSPDDD